MLHGAYIDRYGVSIMCSRTHNKWNTFVQVLTYQPAAAEEIGGVHSDAVSLRFFQGVTCHLLSLWANVVGYYSAAMVGKVLSHWLRLVTLKQWKKADSANHLRSSLRDLHHLWMRGSWRTWWRSSKRDCRRPPPRHLQLYFPTLYPLFFRSSTAALPTQYPWVWDNIKQHLVVLLKLHSLIINTRVNAIKTYPTLYPQSLPTELSDIVGGNKLLQLGSQGTSLALNQKESIAQASGTRIWQPLILSNTIAVST